jgi:hypothetical protein
VINQEFNLVHTLGDIRNYVNMVAPVDGDFQLIEGFPPRPATQMDKTIAELKFQGTTLIQRLT